MIEFIGIVGGCCFAFAAVPAAIRAVRVGYESETPASIAWAVFIGCICLFTYLTAKNGWDWILAGVYGVETSSWGALLWYRYFPRRRGY